MDTVMRRRGERLGWLLATLTVMLSAPAAATAQNGFDVPAASHRRGDPNAKVVIVEFGDFGCSACAAFARGTMPLIKREWIDTGRARVQFVSFDLLRTGRLAARAAECAAEQGAFWPMHDLLYERHKDWLGRGGQDEKFGSWAVELGLDDQRFATCWEQDPSKEVLDRNTRLARSLGVRGTPTFLVNGKVVVGALPYDDFAVVLEEAAKGR